MFETEFGGPCFVRKLKWMGGWGPKELASFND